MDSAELLRQAIQAARAGHELTARDLFQDIVRMDPENEVAWIWLSGLLDPLEDRIMACERVLSINPNNRKIKAYRDKLLDEHKEEHQKRNADLDLEVERIRLLYEQDGKQDEAMFLLGNILREETGHKGAWLLFAELSASVDDKVRAYTSVVQIDPLDKSAGEALKRFRYFQRNPLELAAAYEEDGELDKAIDLYKVLSIQAGDTSAFERIHKNIVRLEDIKIDKIRHIKPSLTILRLSAGLPLLYLFEVFVQEGLNPIKHPTPDLWLGIPLVILGSFLLTIAGIRVQHAIWRRWFGQQGERGSGATRTLVAAAGWAMVLTPHLLLFWDSFLRLQSFQIPPSPWGN